MSYIWKCCWAQEFGLSADAVLTTDSLGNSIVRNGSMCGIKSLDLVKMPIYTGYTVAVSPSHLRHPYNDYVNTETSATIP